MRLLAETVLKNKDPVGAGALADAVSESINNPSFRFSVAYVEKLESLVRKWAKSLLKGAQKGELEGVVISWMLVDYYNLERDCVQQFDRHLG